MKEYYPDQPLLLENGGRLPGLHIGYETYGTLNAAGDNVIWICHALTANADIDQWWPGMVGEGRAFDPQTHFIVCANIIGSCYGSSGPLSIDPATGTAFFSRFPQPSIRDMVQAHIMLRKKLGIRQIENLVGGSMGGYQALEWAITEPALIRSLFLMSTAAAETAWGIAVHASQRLAIEAAPDWLAENPRAGEAGLKAARAIGMLTYRNYEIMKEKQTDPDPEKLDHFKAASYIEYQGKKLAGRFNAYAYWLLTKAMDSHNLSRGRGGDLKKVLNSIRQPALIVGVDNDMLCPLPEQQFLAENMPHARLAVIDSAYGHDGFLVESVKITACLQEWRRQMLPG